MPIVANLKRSAIALRSSASISEDYGEERINLLGMCEGVILHVIYVERGERVRITSA